MQQNLFQKLNANYELSALHFRNQLKDKLQTSENKFSKFTETFCIFFFTLSRTTVAYDYFLGENKEQIWMQYIYKCVYMYRNKT